MADFETRAGENAINECITWVWGWGLNYIHDYNPKIGNSIRTFMKECISLKSAVIYFHSLKFDGVFIIDWLLKNNYTHINKFERNQTGRFFSTLISDTGQFYSIKLVTRGGNNIEFRDSHKKLPFKVSKIAKDFNTKVKKLEIDYLLDRSEGENLTESDEKYLRNDVLIVSEVLEKLYNDGLKEMTIGSDCLKVYKKMIGGNKAFRNLFPVLGDFEHDFAKKSYKGGWCYVNPKYKGKHLKCNGFTHDVNSLYPSVMHSVSKNRYPVGDGVYFKGQYIKDEKYDLYITHFKASFHVKKKHLPTIQLKNSIFAENLYIEDSEGIQELYLTSVDFRLFLEHYDIESIKFIDGYKYQSAIGLFDVYIDKFFNDKCNGFGAVREEAKLFLNNLYGKFAQSISSRRKIPYILDGVVKYKTIEEDDRKPVYMPVGTFVTSYAREFTIQAAQENYDIFAYGDTDSIHCVDKPKNIVEHSLNLLCWKKECEWTEAKFERQKTYIEVVNGEPQLKCAGMNDESKKVFLDGISNGCYNIDALTSGLEIKGKKLRPKTVQGGIILVQTDFKIRS